MPRPNLRRAQPLIAAFCAEHGIRYVETGLFASYRLVLSHLDAIAPGHEPPIPSRGRVPA